jgi:hypothetical protein
MAFCTECGATIPDNVKFCTECGATVVAAVTQPAEVPVAVAIPETSEPVYAPPPVQAIPVQQRPIQPPVSRPAPPPNYAGYGSGDAPPAYGSPYAVMGVGAYIGAMILFCIPIIGWLACIVMAFVAKNQNRRNLARATLVFLVIGAIIGAVLYFVFNWLAAAITAYINEYISEVTGSTFGELGSLTELLEQINGAGAISGIN